MVKNHLKRIAAPKTWSFLRKKHMFITRPATGAHELTQATSINSVVKELLEKANTTKEVKRILKEQEVLIDGKRKHDEKYNVGFMDVITFTKEKESYRLTFTEKGKIASMPVKGKEAEQKISKIIGKQTIKSGKTQVQLNDGRNVLIDKDAYAVGDSLLLELPSQKVVQHLPLQAGAAVMIYKGKYCGTVGEVESIEGRSVFIKTATGSVHTPKSYAFVVGEKKPIIKCSL